ncbi:MAG: hypothetical protein AAB253_03270 [candidate division NC10 bacterium]
MSKLPSDISGQAAVKAFQKAGWTTARYGPHIIMEKEGMQIEKIGLSKERIESERLLLVPISMQ